MNDRFLIGFIDELEKLGGLREFIIGRQRMADIDKVVSNALKMQQDYDKLKQSATKWKQRAPYLAGGAGLLGLVGLGTAYHVGKMRGRLKELERKTKTAPPPPPPEDRTEPKEQARSDFFGKSGA